MTFGVEPSSTVMQNQASIYVFGDQSSSFQDDLQELLLVEQDPALRHFLSESFRTITQEILSLSALDKQAFPKAETLGLLLGLYRARQPHPALEGAFLCIYQVAQYLHLARSFSSGVSSRPNYVLGICTGSLAAAAVSCSSDLNEVVTTGLQAVLVAFRVGILVHRKAQAIAQDGADAHSWSVVTNMQEADAEAMLSDLRDQENTSIASLPYLSTVGLNGVTISGPPEVLKDVVSMDSMSNSKTVSISIFAPYHASHLYTDDDVNDILAATLTGLECYQARIPIFSNTSSSLLESSNFGDLLRSIVTQILTSRMLLDQVVEGISNVLIGDKAASSTLHPIGSHFAPSLAQALGHRGHANVEVSNPAVRLQQNPRVQTGTGTNSSKIAIVGFSGRFPEADGLDQFWDLLKQGLDVHQPVPSDRFNTSHYDPTGRRKNTSKVKHGCWIKEPGLFDARFFQMSPREACQSDPAQRLALLTAYEAIEMAGMVPNRTASSQRDRVGVFYGTTSDDWREVNSGQNIDTYFIPGGNRAFIPGRINYHFKFSGPSVSVDTACSSSLAALNIACNSLLKKDCDTAIAGGTNVMTNPDNFAGLDRGHFLSRTGNCKTFDDSADGYCRADGVGTVILKRLSDAIADNDPVFGVILGVHTNHSAEAVSITRPLATAQEYLFRKLLNESGVKPHEISYVEMHGTGTQAGDAVEMQSVLHSFAWDQSRRPSDTLHLGSVKSNVGHGESASGVTALIKVLLMMRHSAIPPHCGIKSKINHGFPTDLARRNVHIAFQEAEWNKKAHQTRKAFVNNFSAAGGNTAVLLQDGPAREDVKDSITRSHHVFTVSARSPTSLKKRLAGLADFLAQSEEPNLLSQLSYTLTARRIHHNYRVAIVASETQDLYSKLRESSTNVTSATSSKPPKVAFLFTGQGAASTAMGKQLYTTFSSFRADVQHMDMLARQNGFATILALIEGTEEIETLTPVTVQLGTCIFQIALARFWMSLGVEPCYVLGHSLGEYAALAISGTLSINDAIYLCGQRATLIQEMCVQDTHCMLAVEASQNELATLIEDTAAEFACINGPTSVVISGEKSEIEQVCAKLSVLRKRFTRLPVPYAFHSAQVEPMLDELDRTASRVRFNKPSVPIVSSVTGSVITDETDLNPKYIRQHCRNVVNFEAAVKKTQSSALITPDTISIEIGPHPILCSMVKSIAGPQSRCYPSLRAREDMLKTLTGSLTSLYLAGVAVNWDEYHRDFASCRKVLSLPTYNWDLENYWIAYEGDWCLTRGEKAEPPTPPQSIDRQPLRLSSSVHDIIEEVYDKDQASIITESDFNDPELLPVAHGHQVNGLTMCPSSLYADIAHTLSDRLLAQKGGFEGYGVDICDLTAEKALIVGTGKAQNFRVSMKIDWTTRQGSMRVFSVDNSGRQTILHACCRLELQKHEIWMQEWNKYAYLIKRSIERLHHGVEDGSCHRVQSGMAYKLFSTLVQYGPDYHGMRMVTFDSLGLEATALVRLQPVRGQFVRNPYWCDSFGHLTGFLMNATDSLGFDDHVFVNHGWQSMRCSESFSPDFEYQTYVKMQLVGNPKDATYSGDVFVLREGVIRAVYGSVTFRSIPKRVLQMLLPAPKGPLRSIEATSQAAPQKPAQKKRHESEKSAVKGGNSSRQAATLSPTSPGPNSLSALLEETAREMGLQADQLTDETDLTDMGLDSLMSLTILSTMREKLGVDLPSSLFEDYPSVKSLKEYFGNSESDSKDEDSDRESTGSQENSTAATTPDGSYTESLGAGTEAKVTLVVDIIADQIGVTAKNLVSAESFEDLGFDSLMSLTVLASLREEHDLDLPPDFFSQNSDLESVKQALRQAYGSSEPEVVSSKHPEATSVLLQGGKVSSKTLFLFPDGSGSATSYLSLPNISPDVRVYGLNCPYLKCPEDLKVGLQDLTAVYLEEIQRRQPKGPYSLGGWSAGGIAAYHACQVLVNQGEHVERLILLDSPNPIGLAKLPPHFYKFLEKAGVFGDAGGQPAPPWLIQHFLSFIDALDQYKPVPFTPPGAAPATTLIWAKDGVCKAGTIPLPEPQASDTREMTWLLENRKDLGPSGWGTLLERAKLSIETVENANHFTLVKGPSAFNTAAAIRKAMN
ncbi:polyketide synthase [Aureobasidium pullulans]|nr:polyketide synthase [Aureobasidium pullulans]